MSATDAPMCKLCRKAHWAREGCDGKLQERMAQPQLKAVSPEIIANAIENVRRKQAKKKGRKKK